jgi:hypothetical protein
MIIICQIRVFDTFLDDKPLRRSYKDCIFKMDLEKRFSGVAKRGHTMLYGKSPLKSWKADYV